MSENGRARAGPSLTLRVSAQKKGPRSQGVPGGLRTHRFPGAIGRSAAARPCAPCPQAAACLTKRSASLHAGGPLRGPQRHARGQAPGADSPRGHTRFSDLGQPQISGTEPAGSQTGSDGRENMRGGKTGQGRFFQAAAAIFLAVASAVRGPLGKAVFLSGSRSECWKNAARRGPDAIVYINTL